MSLLDRNADARRALGVRPGAIPIPKVNFQDDAYQPRSISPGAFGPPSPTREPSPTSGPSITPYSQPQPPFREISLTPTISHDASLSTPISPSRSSPGRATGSRRFRRPTISRPKAPPQPASRGLYETQKLLAHLIERLESRHDAPDLLERAAIAARKSTGKGKGKEKKKVVALGHAVVAATQAGLHLGGGGSTHASANGSSHQPGVGVSSEDTEEQLTLEEGEWDTEATFDLVQQMLELLSLAEKQHLDLFAATSEAQVPTLDPLPRRKTGRFTSMASPTVERKSIFPLPTLTNDLHRHTSNAISMSGPDLLARLLDVLRTLIEVDCLHRVLHFRPFAPPLALAAACLDIATYIYYKGAPNTQMDVMEIVVDGFGCMGELAVERVCEWIEGRLSELLHRLARARGGPDAEVETNFADPFAPVFPPRKSVPTLAITEDPDESRDQVHSPGWLQYSPTSPTNPFFPPLQEVAGMLSMHAATSEMGPSLLRIASLVSRTLCAVSSTVNLADAKLSTIHRVHRLLSLCLVAKPDAYLDLLEIVAEGDMKARRTAVEVLSTFFPDNMGHNVIARRPALCTYQAQRMKWETGHDGFLGEDDGESHHYIPWRVSSKDGSADGRTLCSGCNSEIHGFGLRCTLCNQFTHLHCYHPPKETFVYEIVRTGAKRGSSQSSVVKFSRCLPTLSDYLLPGGTRDPHSTYRAIGQHHFCRVNLFHLALCEACREPLWGATAQAYACSFGCQKLYHHGCLDSVSDRSPCRHGQEIVIDERSAGRNPFSISLESFQRSFDQHVKPLCLDEQDLAKRSYDEIAVLFGALWTQQQILKNGLSSGSIVLYGHDPKESDLFGIRATLRVYEDHLRAHEHEASTATVNFANVVDLPAPLGTGYIFSPRFLAYCTALIRSPTNPHVQPSTSDGLLTASGIPAIPADQTADGAFEMLQLSTLHQSLAHDLNIVDIGISTLLLDRLQCNGLISSSAPIDSDAVRHAKGWVSFGLPLLIDSSSTVELLIGAIEKLLDDLDLTMNETALRLLHTRAFPSLLCSPYALERLGVALIKWVMATVSDYSPFADRQESSLHRIVKEYASKHRRIPGLRLPADDSKQAGLTSVSLYQQDHATLVKQFAQPWLSALHAQDPELYSHILYEQCKAPLDETADGEAPSATQIAGVALDRMTSLVDAGVVFGVMMDLLTAWLEDLGALAGQDVIYKSLPRLLRHHGEGSQGDLWQLAHQTAHTGQEGLGRVCRWMRVLSFSGVEIPWSTLLELVGLQSKMPCSHETSLDLCIAVNANGANIDGPGLAEVASTLYAHLVADIHRQGVGSKPSTEDISFLRQTLWLALRAYGVSLEEIGRTSLGTAELVSKQPASMSKRRRGTLMQTTFGLNESVILYTAEVLATGRYPTPMLFDFLWLLLSHAHSVDNIDATIYNLCAKLFPVIWPTMNQDMDRRTRDRVILRLLSINSLPLQKILEAELISEHRSAARENLLRFILGLADDTVTSENHSWRPSVVPLILVLFDSLSQPTDTNAETIVTLKCLLPTHLRAMSACFEEYLVQGSDEHRLKLLTKLHRLRLNLPQWPILEDLITEEVANVTQLKAGKSSQAVSALIDCQLIRASLIALGLNMLATGIGISSQTAQRFQQHVAALCTIPWSQPDEGVINLVLPALRNVLDSSRHLTVGISPATRDKQGRLVGSLFVPIVVDYAKVLDSHAFMVQRYLLDILLVTFFKQDIKPVELAALGSLQKLAEFAVTSDCTENQSMAISIVQQASSKMDKTGFLRVAPFIFASLSDLLIREIENDGDTSLIDQTTALLRSLVKQFGKSGLFFEILKLETSTLSLGRILPLLYELHDSDSRATLLQSIELVLVDGGESLKRDRKTLDAVMASLDRFFGDLKVDISDNAAELCGSFLVRLSKHVAEWTIADFDPKHILDAASAALRLVSRSAGQTLIHQVSTLLHLCITRFRVELETVRHLVDASERLAKSPQENSVRVVLLETAASALRGNATTATSLSTLLQYLCGTTGADQVIVDGATGCERILLRNHPTMVILSNAQRSVEVLTSAAQVLLKAESISPGSLGHALGGITIEAAGVQLDAFIYILLASCESPASDTPGPNLGTLYPIIARAASLSLRASGDFLSIQDATGSGAELLSSVYAVLRLLVLRHRLGSEKTGDEVEALWSRIWPDLYRLIGLSMDKSCANAPLRAIAHSIFLDLVIFLSTVHSPLLETHAGSLSHTLQLIVHLVETTDIQAPGKLIKAVECLEPSENSATGGEVDVVGILKDLRGDLMATEKIRGLRNLSSG